MIEQILQNIGYHPDTKMQHYVSEWRDWYKGYVKSFHRYNTYNGKAKVGRTRASLKMAKKVCEDWANLLLNEKVDINVGDEQLNKQLTDIFEKNDFYVRSNMLLEKAFALGSGAFVEYYGNNHEIVIDFISADMIYPISWNDTDITECAFASEKVINGKKYYYINIHTLDAAGNYIVQNRLFDADKGAEFSLPGNVEPYYNTGSSTRLYQIIRPNITNNIEDGTPMGISVFANALDELMGVDLVYDSYLNEFRLGKKRIILPTSMAQIQKEKDGVAEPIFDSNDTEFYCIPGLESESQKPIEINMTIRGAEHKDALHTNINLLSDKCGLGNGRYTYETNGVKTATEVISEKSDLFQNLKKHEIILKSALISLVRAVFTLIDIKSEIEVEIDFDDSIIEDAATEFTQRLQLVSSGAIKAWELRAWYLNETDAEAQKALEGAADNFVEEE